MRNTGVWIRSKQRSSDIWLFIKPYVYALLLLITAYAFMWAGDKYLIKFGFPWSLVALLVIAAVATLWRNGPAFFVLLLSAVFGDKIVPDLHVSYIDPAGNHLSWQVRAMRFLMFGTCGLTMIAISWQSRRMRESAERKRAVVQALQSMVLPEALATVPSYDIAALYRPARQEEEVGGDFYDVFPLDQSQEQYGVLMGDVVGKGKEAAAFTALLRYSCRAYAALSLGPAEILRKVNSLVDAQGFNLGTATVFFCLLNQREGSIVYANAGHEPPILTRAFGHKEILSATGPLIGVLEEAIYEETQIRMEIGDSLFLVTDGVTEARDHQGCFLDDAGTWELLRQALPNATAMEVVDHFHQRLEHFMAGQQRDDIAVLFLRRLAPSTASLLNPLQTSLPPVSVNMSTAA